MPFYQPTSINVFFTEPGAYAPAMGLFAPAYTASAGVFTGIDPNLVAASYLGFQQAGAASLETVTNEGGALYQGNASLFGQWASYQNEFLQTVGNAFADAEQKSASACGGFFSCLFG